MEPSAPAPTFADPPLGEFLLCGSQQGAEDALRERFAASFPGSRPGAWRKGVVTFRLPAAEAADTGGLPSGEILDQLVFARTLIHSLGQVTGRDSATLAAAATGALLHWTTPFGPGWAAMLAAVASVTGMFGSLVFAAIKRDKGVKDWSHLIPGQGGFLDQMDSVIFAAPVFYHLTHLIWT